MSGARPAPGNRSSARFGANLSRRLRAAGYNIMPSARKHKADGVTVSGAGNDFASVLIDIRGAARRTALADEMTELIEAWGFRVNRVDYEGHEMTGLQVHRA
jgi:hypothetical protein